MLTRVYDPAVVADALKLYPFGEIKLDAEDWFDNPVVVFSDDDGNIGIFEEYFPRVYTGHYFFKSGGKAAKSLAVEMMTTIFDDYEAEALRGLTPVEHKAAIWMTRHLGFKDYGEVDTAIGPCIVFVMTRKEFKEKYNG